MKHLARWIRSLLLGLGLANLATAALRLPVLGWFADRRRDALAGVALSAAMAGSGRVAWWLLPLALPLQMAAASLRGLRYHPLRALAPGAPGVSAVELPTADGRGLPALLIEPARPARGGLVICHGAGNDKTKYAWRMLAALRDAGFTLLAIDLDGHGASRRPLRIPGVEDNVGVAVQWLRGRCGWVGLAGVSLGGAVAARAVADGVRVDALAVIESPAELDLTALRYQWSEFKGFWRLGFWRAADRVTPLQLLREWGGRMETSHTLREIFDLLDLRGSLRRVDCPTLLLYGTDDVIAPFGLVQPILADMPAASLHLHRGTHLTLTMESGPLDDLAAWLV
ncbi:MAG TPA: alpha/beta hydrolase, partial [Herpetosiphonaceae bacterium]|nr:alpha/beta hydrolase [Herpetosiphonaceae bacterium]